MKGSARSGIWDLVVQWVLVAVPPGRWHVIGPRAFGAEGRPQAGLGGDRWGLLLRGGRGRAVDGVGAAGMGAVLGGVCGIRGLREDEPPTPRSHPPRTYPTPHIALSLCASTPSGRGSSYTAHPLITHHPTPSMTPSPSPRPTVPRWRKYGVCDVGGVCVGMCVE